MAEYICREAIIDDLEKEIEAGNVALDEDVWINKGLRIAIRDIKDIKTAEVQPVDRWISVKDRLPESEKEVLVWYRYTWGAAPTSYGFGINRWYSNTKQWRDGCLLKGVEVLYWQPLPEPPKDGDTRNLTDEETDIYNNRLEAEAEMIDEISLL